MASVSESTSTERVVLYTQGTPNGWPISILLEELKGVYGRPDYESIAMSIRDSDIGKVHYQVKQPWFLEISPNGRIPAITHNNFNVSETSAILLYLCQQFDKDHIFSHDPVADPQGYSQELQWLFFAHGGIGPMQGQANHFNIFAPIKIPYAINRYLNETKRLYGVLESHLAERDYIVGAGRGSYGIADIKAFGWIRAASRTGVPMDELPNLRGWVARISERPSMKDGIKVYPDHD